MTVKLRQLLSRMSERECLFLILFLGCLIRIAAIIAYPNQPRSDELVYISMAENLVNGRGLIDLDSNAAMYNAGYPFFVLAPIFVIFGTKLLFVKLANTIFGVASIWLCHAVAKEAGAGKLGRLLAALGWAIYLPASLYVVYVFKENLLTPVMLAVMWFALRFRTKSTPLMAIACGVLFGLICLIGNAALVLAVPVLFAIMFRPHSIGKEVRTIVLIVLSASIVASPWLVRNYILLGGAVLNTNGGFNLYLGNNPNATGTFVSIAETPRGPTWEELRKDGEIRASNTLKEEAVAWIRANPVSFVSLALKKLALFWAIPLHKGLEKTSAYEDIIRFGWVCQYLVLAGVLAASAFRRPFINDRTAVIWLALIAYTAVHMLFYVVLRYREPIMPLVCVLAALGIEKLLSKNSSLHASGPRPRPA